MIKLGFSRAKNQMSDGHSRGGRTSVAKVKNPEYIMLMEGPTVYSDPKNYKKCRLEKNWYAIDLVWTYDYVFQ